jgi:hypothetical protein
MHLYKLSKAGLEITSAPKFLPIFLFSVLLISLFVSIPTFLLNAYSITAQSRSLVTSSLQSSSESVVKGLLTGAIQSLNSGNTSNALDHLKVIDQQLSASPSGSTLSLSKQNGNFSSTWAQTAKLLVQDAIRELSSGNKRNALTYLSLAAQQSGIQLPSNQSSTKNVINFVTYYNPLLGVKIQHPSNWTVIEYPYNPQVNNTIAAFFSNSKTGSEIGNVSGVGGKFVPYLDIYVFDSKNMSLHKLINATIAKFHNNPNFAINQSKTIILRNNHPADLLVYTVNVGGDELFRKMQLYTLFGNKAFVVTFTSQEALFSNYLAAAQKMLQSFDASTR